MTHDVNPCQKELAARIRSTLIQQIGLDEVNLWFGAESSWTLDNTGLLVTVPNRFMADCVRNFCWKELKETVFEVVGPGTPVKIDHISILPPSLERDLAQKESFNGKIACDSPNLQGLPNLPGVRNATVKSVRMGIQASSSSTGKRFSPVEQARKRASTHSPVYCDKEFDHKPIAAENSSRNMKFEFWTEFIEGEQNRLALTAAQMVLERPGTITPLLLHGPCGVGKSHLARAIGEQLRVRHQLRRVIYLTSEQFTIDFADSVRGSGFANFRRKYRDVEALILDDIQFLLGKSSTLTEFRNTVDNLLRNKRQVVLVADRSLSELAGIGNELHARLSGGMSCVMEPLDIDTRLRLMQRLCNVHSIEISDLTLNVLVRMASGDARILYGMAFRLLTEQRSKGRPVTEDEALRCTQELLRASQPVIRMADIDKAVCDIFGLEPKSLQTKGKSKVISQPRMLAMFLARKYTRAAYSEIGQYFGNRQHSTVISAHRKVEDWLESNEALAHSRGTLPIRDMLRNLESTLQVG